MIPCIIPARGSSVRLKRKNILDFCGKPLFIWSVLQARHSKLIDDVYVSTDNVVIGDICEKNKVKWIRRPDWGANANLFSAIVPIKHALQEIEREHDFDAFVVLLPTSPIRKPDDLDGMISLFKKVRTTAVIPLYNPKETVIYERSENVQDLVRLYLFDKDYNYLTQAGGCSVHNKEHWLEATKDAPDTDKEHDKATKKGAGVPGLDFQYYYPFDWYQQFDIDDKDDFELCEILMQRYILNIYGEDCYD